METHVEPGFPEKISAAFAEIAARLATDGTDLTDAEVTMHVTGRTDAEVALIQHRAAELGIGAMRFVDDHRPPRPGTVSSATLSPIDSSLAAECRARRVLGNS